MRLFWGVVLVGGLLLVGLDVYEGWDAGSEEPAAMRAEDGSPWPTPPPPPPPQ